jgi:hypothetical protein
MTAWHQRLFRALGLSIALWLALTGCANANEGKSSATNEIRPSLWQVIEALGSKRPLTASLVERELDIHLTEQTRNEHMLHLSSTGTTLSDGVKLDKVDLVLSPNGKLDKTSGLALELSGTCLRLDELRERFGELQIIQAPRGHSLEETTVHSAKQPWGILTFGFKEAAPDCLARITFRRAPV